MTGEERVSYRAVLANREFLAILVSQGLSTLGDQLARIAVAILVYQETGSALWASATFAVSYLTYLLGGPVLSAISDRRPRVTVMVACDLLRVPAVLIMCLDDQPLWVLFVALAFVGLLAPPFDSARSAIQPEILEGPAYVVGNALINVVLQAGQVAGFVAGGALVAALSTRGALAMDAATFLLSAGCVLSLVRHRPAAQAREEQASLLTDTGRGIRLVRSSPDLLRYLGISVLASVAVIAPEGLAVPAATDLGRGSVAAGILTATIPVGFVLGSPVLLRLDVDRRLSLLLPLCVLCMLPLVASPLAPNVATLTVLWTVAGLGASLNLVASAAFVQACPPAFRSRAYGVAVTTLYGAQGLVLLASGALADLLGPRGAVAAIAAVSLAVLFSLPALRNDAPQGTAQTVR